MRIFSAGEWYGLFRLVKFRISFHHTHIYKQFLHLKLQPNGGYLPFCFLKIIRIAFLVTFTGFLYRHCNSYIRLWLHVSLTSAFRLFSSYFLNYPKTCINLSFLFICLQPTLAKESVPEPKKLVMETFVTCPSMTFLADSLNVIKTLKLGQRVPEEFWTKEHLIYFEGKPMITTFEQYRGKPLLIDFWATWCKSCIEGFPKLELIQRKFGSEVNILLVNTIQTQDTPDKVSDMFARYNEQHNYSPSLPYIIQDTVMLNYFPHQLLPHMVWINSNDQLMYHSYSMDATEYTVGQFISDGTVNIYQKDDLSTRWTDRAQKFLDSLGVIYGSLFSGYVEGSRFEYGPLDSKVEQSQFYFTNYSYRMLFLELYSDMIKNIPSTRWIFSSDIDKNSKYQFCFPHSMNDAHSYLLRIPQKIDIQYVLERVKKDVEQHVGLKPVYKNQLSRTLTIKSTSRVKQLVSKGGISYVLQDPIGKTFMFDNVPLSFYLSRMAEFFDIPILLDQIPKDRIDIVLPNDILDYSEQELISLLEEQGFEVHETFQEIEFIVFERPSASLNQN